MIDRFLWLRELDEVYAQETLKTYLQDKDCPVPDLGRLVRAEWMKQQRDKGLKCTF